MKGLIALRIWPFIAPFMSPFMLTLRKSTSLAFSTLRKSTSLAFRTLPKSTSLAFRTLRKSTSLAFIGIQIITIEIYYEMIINCIVNVIASLMLLHHTTHNIYQQALMFIKYDNCQFVIIYKNTRIINISTNHSNKFQNNQTTCLI